jgi:hypothetical protein
MTTHFFTEKEVAEMFRISRSALRRRRFLGLAPGYIQIGRNIRYPKEALIEFARCISHPPTNITPSRMESSALAAGHELAVNAGPTPNNLTKQVESNHD